MGSSAPGSIRVRLFASLREQAGWGERDWPLAEPTTAQQMWAELGLARSLDGVRVAINQRFASADTPLESGDELAFLPPISGG